MTTERKDFWLRAFYTLGQVWPFLEGTADRIRVYDAALEDLSLVQLERAVGWLVGYSTEKYAPTPGAIRAAISQWNVLRNTGCNPPEPKLLSMPHGAGEAKALPQARHRGREGVPAP